MTNYDPHQSVSSPNNSDRKPRYTNAKQTVSIEGKISQVMETSPLQLMVETKQGSYYVALVSETKISQQGTIADSSNLNLGQTVKIQGLSSTGDRLAMTARTIAIQS